MGEKNTKTESETNLFLAGVKKFLDIKQSKQVKTNTNNILSNSKAIEALQKGTSKAKYIIGGLGVGAGIAAPKLYAFAVKLIAILT